MESSGYPSTASSRGMLW